VLSWLTGYIPHTLIPLESYIPPNEFEKQLEFEKRKRFVFFSFFFKKN
jgi:hypothetical protein